VCFWQVILEDPVENFEILHKRKQSKCYIIDFVVSVTKWHYHQIVFPLLYSSIKPNQGSWFTWVVCSIRYSIKTIFHRARETFLRYTDITVTGYVMLSSVAELLQVEQNILLMPELKFLLLLRLWVPTICRFVKKCFNIYIKKFNSNLKLQVQDIFIIQ
jgi:hypothetical protein